MAQEVVLRLRVEGEDEIKAIRKEVDKTSETFEDASKYSERYSGSIKKSNPIVEELDRRTGGLVNTVLDLGDATKKAGISFRALRTALIATGIGALVVALGLVVAYWDDIVDYIKQTNKDLERQVELQKTIQSTLEAELGLLESQIALNEKQGKATAELQKQRIELNKKIQQSNELEIKALRIQLARLEAQQDELGLWDAIRLKIGETIGGGIAEEAARIQTERITGIEKLRETLLEAEKKAVDLDIALFNLENPQSSEGGESRRMEQQTGVNELSPEVAAAQQVTAELVGEMGRRQELLNQAELNGIMIREQYRQENIARVKTALGALQNIFGAFGKESKALAIGQIIADKVSAVSQIISNTAIANAKSLAVSPLTGGQPWVGINTTLAGLSIAGTVAGAIQAINQLKSNSTSIGGGTALPSGIGGSGVSAQPSFNVIGNTGINQLNDTIADQTNEPVRAYVTMRDIERGQDVRRNSISEASVG